MTGDPSMTRAAQRPPHGRVLLLAAICALLALSTACSHHHRAHEAMNQREYASYRGSGAATISGQVTMTLQDGTVLDGSACQVRLTPITTESKKYIENVVMTGGTSPWKENADSVWWLATADQEGRFRFEEVPAGDYYLTCLVAWREPGSGSTRQRILWTETSVEGSASVDVAVSR